MSVAHSWTIGKYSQMYEALFRLLLSKFTRDRLHVDIVCISNVSTHMQLLKVNYMIMMR